MNYTAKMRSDVEYEIAKKLLEFYPHADVNTLCYLITHPDVLKQIEVLVSLFAGDKPR